MKIRPQYDRISKILSRGWQAQKNWFLTFMTFLAPVIFSIHEILKKYQKMAGSKKVLKVENQFFHVCQPRERIFEIQSYQGLIFTTDSPNFEELFPSFETFFQNFFWLKSLQMLRTISGWMPSEIWQKWGNSTVYVV